MVSFFRRRKPATLSLFEREAVGPDVAVVQSAVGEPEQEKLAVVDSEPGNLPPVLPEPDEVEAKAMPAEFVSAGPAASNLYAIPNLGVEFAITQESPGESAVEIDEDSELAHEENLEEKPVATEGDAFAQEALSIWQAVAAAGNPVLQSPAKRAPAETEDELESSEVESLPDQSVAGHEAEVAEEFKAVEEPLIEDTLPTESASADEVPIEDAATDSPVAEATVEIVSVEPVVPEVTEVESSTFDQVDREVAHRLAVLEDALRRQASAAPSKPKRTWWSFWRKRQPLKQSVIAGELSVIDSPAIQTANENSAPEEVAAADQVAAEQLPATESAVADASLAESIIGEPSTADTAAEILPLVPDVSHVTEAELPAGLLVNLEAAESDSHPDEPLPLDVLGVEPAAAEPLSETVPAIENALEIASVENGPTTEEFAVLENARIESAPNEAEQIDLSLDPATIVSAGSEAAADLGTAGMPPTETSDSVPVPQDSAPELAETDRAVVDPAALEPEANAAIVTAEDSAPEGDISIAEEDPPETESLAAREEDVPANVSDVLEVTQLSVQSSEQSNESTDGLGLLDLPRVAEPEVMDDAEEVEAYASATTQAWLDKIDDSFIEHASRLVKSRHRGRALDIGTGPGQIALKLALRLSLWKIVGVDRSQKMIDEALAKLAATAAVTGRLEFRVADGNRLDFPDATFDLVICNSVLHHFAEPRNLLAEIARVTKPRGAILLRDLRRPSRLKYPIHVRWHGRHYDGAMSKLYRDSVRAAYTVPELQRLLDTSPLRGARVFRHGSTHMGLERPCN